MYKTISIQFYVFHCYLWNVLSVDCILSYIYNILFFENYSFYNYYNYLSITLMQSAINCVSALENKEKWIGEILCTHFIELTQLFMFMYYTYVNITHVYPTSNYTL